LQTLKKKPILVPPFLDNQIAGEVNIPCDNVRTVWC